MEKSRRLWWPFGPGMASSSQAAPSKLGWRRLSYLGVERVCMKGMWAEGESEDVLRADGSPPPLSPCTEHAADQQAPNYQAAGGQACCDGHGRGLVWSATVPWEP